MMLFQAPQASHLPDHLEWTAPQDWQTKVADVRAISRPLTRGRFAPLPSPPTGEREEPALAQARVRGNRAMIRS